MASRGGLHEGMKAAVMVSDECRGVALLSTSAGGEYPFRSLLKGVAVPLRCRANMAHMRQPRPDFGLGFQINVLPTFEAVPSLLGRSLWMKGGLTLSLTIRLTSL